MKSFLIPFFLLVWSVSQTQGRDGCESIRNFLCGTEPEPERGKCIRYDKTCTCGGEELYGNAGLPTSYCCLPDQAECKFSRGNANCVDGTVTNLTEPCNGKCFTEYRTLRNRTEYGGLRATYQCENGDCVLMREMCNGYAACQDESDLKECDDDLQCISTNGGYEITSYQGHYTCSYINAENDGEYDNIHRKDEDYLFKKVDRVNFNEIELCNGHFFR